MVTKKDGWIILYVNPNFSYEIEEKRIKIEGLNTWLTHLREKNWFTLDVEKEFISSIT